MALVTYRGKASRIRIAGGTVLERLVPAEIPTAIARDLSPADFDVVLPVRRPPGRSSSPRRGRRAARATSTQQKES
jgi:hypothetical protein